MIVYCDRLTTRSMARAMVLRHRAKHRDGWIIRVLDDAPAGGIPRWCVLVARMAGVTIEVADFKAGRLHDRTGERVPLAAHTIANRLAFSAAGQLIASSPTLSRVNTRWRRNTVQLHIAKSLWLPLFQLCLRIQVARILAFRDGTRPCLVLHHPSRVDSRWLEAEFEDVDLHWCSGTSGRLKSAFNVADAVVRASRTAVGQLTGWPKVLRHPAVPVAELPIAAAPTQPKPPGVLVLQQDDLGTDRSHRTQPHWILPEDGVPGFRTFILQKSYVRRSPFDTAALRAQRIFVLGNPLAFVLRHLRTRHVELADLRRDILACLAGVATRWSGADATALWSTAVLLLRSWVLAKVCLALNIKVFVSAEGFLIETDAMTIVAPSLGIMTLSYQYSNLSRNSVVMMTTADMMLAFSAAYDPVWIRGDIRPARMIANGYVFDSSFGRLRERALAQRARFAAAGATFVVCFFDESIQHDKYGIIQADDHNEELLLLLRMVARDPTFGLVIKTQYCRNTPSELLAGRPELDAALQTGRYFELKHGIHRNTAFAAEAALMTDISIGNSIGATASLEAALAGCRSILVNSYGLTGVHDALYGQANIVFGSLADALAAVQHHRAGDPVQKGLGDWTPILRHFDPFRDGNAGRRIRLLVDELTMGTGHRADDIPASEDLLGASFHR